jgi:hypothetical protein
MTEEERLRDEIERIEKDIATYTRKIESVQWQAEAVNDAVSQEQDYRLRGKLVQKHGQMTDQIMALKDAKNEAEATLEELKAQWRQEISFSESRRPEPNSRADDAPAITASDHDEHYSLRRQLPQKRKLKP